ncbi:hypothetical protein AB0A85_05565, partial [Kitasatospora aureofaciens]
MAPGGPRARCRWPPPLLLTSWNAVAPVRTIVRTGLLGGMSPLKVLEAFGTGFASSRSVTVFAVA